MSKELIERLRSFCSKADCADAGDLIEELETENDQLSEQVTLLRDVVGHVAGMRFSIVTTKMCEAALAATEPKA